MRIHLKYVFAVYILRLHFISCTYSIDMPTNIANMMGVRTRIRDKQMHQQLKADLVEHICRKFGRDEDNN